ncbi:MAG TPA: class I SAM-dependent methyltransferase [Candidatus Udaeobacter sp.]|nr:class I SAM-dependent methyltransferase [Candidatus Udaeobacter sp.]
MAEYIELVNALSPDAHTFEISRSDPRLAQCLEQFPCAIFTERLYQSIELIERYSIELAVDLARQLDIAGALAEWQSADQISRRLSFQPTFRCALCWILERLAETGCVEVRGNRESRSYRLQRPLWESDLKTLRAIGADIDPGNAATLDLLDHVAGLYPAAARNQQSGDGNLLGPQGVPLWLKYFHNDNLTYAVNNWVGAALAADRLSSRRTLRILEVGAGTGSASEILLESLAERGLLSRVERYLITEPNAYFRRCAQRHLAAKYPALPLEWAALDVDLPWQRQGVNAAEFDLVYCVNVMHISKDLMFSLSEARSTLASDGWLVLGECVRPYDNQPIYPEFMFQILNSFTNVQTDPEFRPNPGFLTAEQWRRAFSRAGFAHVGVAPDIERIREIYPHFFTGAICGQNR